MQPPASPPRSTFRRLFFRGLAIVLPTVLTLWLVVKAYQFVDTTIAQPINRGVKQAVIHFTPWPSADDVDLEHYPESLSPAERKAYFSTGSSPQWLVMQYRQNQLESWWNRYTLGSWPIMDLIGLAMAIGISYLLGLAVGSFLGKRLVERSEELMARMPIMRLVYPHVKQITNFLVGDSKKLTFNHVVALEYPRPGIWSVAFVMGPALQVIQDKSGRPCLSLFVPTSPTPFTGFTITAPKDDTFELPLSIDEALKYIVSGGLLLPPELAATDPTMTLTGPTGPQHPEVN